MKRSQHENCEVMEIREISRQLCPYKVLIYLEIHGERGRPVEIKEIITKEYSTVFTVISQKYSRFSLLLMVFLNLSFPVKISYLCLFTVLKPEFHSI